MWLQFLKFLDEHFSFKSSQNFWSHCLAPKLVPIVKCKLNKSVKLRIKRENNCYQKGSGCYTVGN